MTENLDEKEKELQERLLRLTKIEAEIKKKEKSVKEKEKTKKQILLRVSPSLWTELAEWAEEDYRSINSQIEYLLTECVKKKYKK